MVSDCLQMKFVFVMIGKIDVHVVVQLKSFTDLFLKGAKCVVPLLCANANKDGGVVTKAVVSSAMAAYFHRPLPDGAVELLVKQKLKAKVRGKETVCVLPPLSVE